MSAGDIGLAREEALRSQGHLARALSRLRRKRIAVVCIGILIVIYGAAIFAGVVSPYGYDDQDYTAIRQSPSLSHWMGTDFAGRDVLTRTIWGVQNSLIITFIAMATGSLVIGVSLGLISGYFGGRTDALVQRTGELFASFPDIFLVIILAATLKPRVVGWVRALEDHTFLTGLVRSGVADYLVISVALVAFSWFGMARLVRGQVLALRATQYVEAAVAMGSSTSRILFVHVLPNAISPIVVTVTMGMGVFIGTEIILGFLGLGVQPPRPSLGVMLREGGSISALRNDWWLLLAPGTAAALLLLSWNLLGDALNDVLNPRTR